MIKLILPTGDEIHLTADNESAVKDICRDMPSDMVIRIKSGRKILEEIKVCDLFDI